jgi:prefoldin subunit 5
MSEDHDVVEAITKIAVLENEIGHLENTISKMEKRVEELENQNEAMKNMAAKWKGGAAVLIALGSVSGAVLSFWESIRGYLGKLGG